MRGPIYTLTLVSAFFFLSGCFNPVINEGKQCGPGDSCPTGFDCDGEDQVCKRSPDSEDDAGPSSDASADGPVADGPSADAFVGEHILLYAGPTLAGNFGTEDRTGIQEHCATAIVDCAEEVQGFLSITKEDSLFNMPKAFRVPVDIPIVSKNGTVIAGEWESLFDNVQEPLLKSLSEAGVLPPNTSWWSGTNAIGGHASGQDCEKWQSTNPTTGGRIGRSNNRDTGWVSSVNGACDNALPILCICFEPSIFLDPPL